MRERARGGWGENWQIQGSAKDLKRKCRSWQSVSSSLGCAKRRDSLRHKWRRERRPRPLPSAVTKTRHTIATNFARFRESFVPAGGDSILFWSLDRKLTGLHRRRTKSTGAASTSLNQTDQTKQTDHPPASSAIPARPSRPAISRVPPFPFLRTRQTKQTKQTRQTFSASPARPARPALPAPTHQINQTNQTNEIDQHFPPVSPFPFRRTRQTRPTK